MEGNEKRKVQDTKETSDCTLHLQDGRGEKGSDGERLKTSDEEENMKSRRLRRAGKKLRRGMNGYGRILTSMLGSQ